MRVAVALLLVGCIKLGRAPRPEHARLAALAPPAPELCARLQSRALWLGLSAIGVGGIGGAASTLSGAVDSTPLRWGLVGVGGGLSIVGAVLSYASSYSAAQFTRKGCQ